LLCTVNSMSNINLKVSNAIQDVTKRSSVGCGMQ